MISWTLTFFVIVSWAVTFLVIALIAAVLGFSGIAGTAANLAWICAVIGIMIAVFRNGSKEGIEIDWR